jgi:hypothetical protein
VAEKRLPLRSHRRPLLHLRLLPLRLLQLLKIRKLRAARFLKRSPGTLGAGPTGASEPGVLLKARKEPRRA